ncbi:MAG: DegT/DnrJ/EryC1/StrS family aminotransferase [Clostridia bacterium]|nr:DegT/DnrJ/EryC1/StrS family aminotransferase [Clostridia bacterium]
MHIQFSPPDITEVEINEVAEALKSGWITTGPRVKKLEKKIAEFVGAGFSDDGTPRCVCLNSQTACAEMTLRLLGIGKGDEVITSAYTYTASASVIDHVGAKIILVDTQKDSLEMDYDALEKAITVNTKAIIPVDLGGIPCDYDKIFGIVEKKKDLFTPSENDIQKAIGRIVVLADAAHAFGATYHGKPVGSIADFSAFSFHAVKNFTTGEGGAVVWKRIDGIDDNDIYRRFQLLSLHGQSKDAFSKDQPGDWEYDIVGTYYKCNMTDFTAAIGLGQFVRLPKLLERRKEIIKKYDAALRPLGVKTLPHFTENYVSSGHLYITNIPDITGEERNEIIRKMAEKGVCCNVHYKPLPLHTAYKNLGFDAVNFPNAVARFTNEITLPLYTLLKDEETDYIVKSYAGILKDYLK